MGDQAVFTLLFVSSRKPMLLLSIVHLTYLHPQSPLLPMMKRKEVQIDNRPLPSCASCHRRYDSSDDTLLDLQDVDGYTGT